MTEDLIKTEKSIVRKLEETTSSIEQKLMLALELDPKINQSYEKWQTSTLEAIKESEKISNEGSIHFYIKRDEIVNEG